MKKIMLLTLLMFVTLSLMSQTLTKLYKSGGYVVLEKEGIFEYVFNPSQSNFVIETNRFILYDNVKGYNVPTIYENLTDSSGVLYSDKNEIIDFLKINLTPVINIQTSEGIIDDNNPFPIHDIDENFRGSLNTLFGDKITGIRKTSIAAQFQYGVEDGTSDVELENGGTIVLENSLLKIRSGTNAAGRARIQSSETVRYVPGQELYCFFTVVFDTAENNSFQRVGLFDDDNGFFVGYEDTVFKFTRRRESVDYQQNINIDSFNLSNNYTFIPQRGNIYRISYGYLGFAPINLEVLKPNGKWLLLSKIEYPNSSTVTHTTQTFLPVRGEVVNTGNNTNLEIRSGSLAAGIVDGGGEDIAGRQFSWANPETITFSDSTTLVTFRNKTTFQGISNRVPARLLLISGANAANKTLKWRLLKNPTLEASPVPVWTDVNTNNSTLEYSTNAVANYSASTDLFLAWNTGVAADFFEFVEDLTLDLPPGGMASFVIYSKATNAEADLSIRWSELF